VLDLYSQANSKSPDSPPMLSSSETSSRDKIIPQPISESASSTPNGKLIIN